MAGQEPRVSVCIPTYNRAAMLREAICSVLEQSFADFELIVSDNASSDATESVVRQFADSRIRYVRSATNIGHRANWNQCLRLARGEYIAILPDDDLMLPENLAVKVDVLSRYRQAGLVHSKYHLIDDTGRIVQANTNWAHGPERTADAFHTREEVLSARGNIVNAPTVLFRRACYERLGGFTDRLRFSFDYEYWMRVAAYYEVVFLAQPLVKWRIHSGAITNVFLAPEEEGIKRIEVLAARRLVLKKHSPVIPRHRELKAQVEKELRETILDHVDALLEQDALGAQARGFLLEMGRSFPELMLEKAVWKALLKSVLGRKTVDALKRFSVL